MKDKRHFTVIIGSEEVGRYSGASPRAAAVKVARVADGTEDKPVEFTIRELGQTKRHTYSSYVDERSRTETDPAWLGDSIRVAHVEKIGYSKD